MSHLKLPSLPPYQKQQRKSYAGFSSASLQPASATSNFSNTFQLIVTAPTSAVSNLAVMGTNEKLPDGFTIMENQVAGHTFHVGSDEIGMLKSVDDGSVYKPGGKPMCCAREIKFYEQLLTTTDKDILPLREFTAEYRGTQTLNVGSKTVNFIKLRDLTYGMLEPCIMDIKIGRRTWDPLTTEHKRKMEESKYADCKNTVCFCIPGFQTYHIASGTYKKFGKEYGKKLNENTVKDGK
jgi:1D-myo-inositol-tetrakisphosphate 5-kinase/inositol-polyphosphate multikinase